MLLRVAGRDEPTTISFSELLYPETLRNRNETDFVNADNLAFCRVLKNGFVLKVLKRFSLESLFPEHFDRRPCWSQHDNRPACPLLYRLNSLFQHRGFAGARDPRHIDDEIF